MAVEEKLFARLHDGAPKLASILVDAARKDWGFAEQLHQALSLGGSTSPDLIKQLGIWFAPNTVPSTAAGQSNGC